MVIRLWTETEDIFLNDQVIPFDFSAKDMLKSVAGGQVATGWTVSQIKDRIMLLEKIEGASDIVSLSDNEVSFLIHQMKSAGFTIPSKNILKLVDILENGAGTTTNESA